MPYNLLLLPLLGGYLFLRWWNPTRYHAMRAEKERLLLLASIPGLISLIIAFAIVKGLGAAFPCSSWPRLPCFPAWWADNVPFDYSGTSLLAFSLSAVMWLPLNVIFKRDRAIDKVIEEDRVAFELLLKKAQDQTKTVSVTMSNGKVYVGWVTHLFNPALPTRFIEILPLKSGYRDDKSKWLEFTTFYFQALDKIDMDFEAELEKHEQVKRELVEVTALHEEKKEKSTELRIQDLNRRLTELKDKLEELAITADDFGIVLPVSEIMSINIFSEYIHSKYFGDTAHPFLIATD